VVPASLIQTLRSRWFAIVVHAGLWLLVYLAVTRLDGSTSEYREVRAAADAGQSQLPFTRSNGLFAADQYPKPLALTNLPDPFITRYFVPPPKPAPPPPPTTRKIEVVYLGYYQTADAPQDAILKVEDAFVIARPGRPIATNWFIARPTMQSLLLTNLTAQTNLLLLNVKKEIEIPIR
jgi:hypothetical protein